MERDRRRERQKRSGREEKWNEGKAIDKEKEEVERERQRDIK